MIITPTDRLPCVATRGMILLAWGGFARRRRRLQIGNPNLHHLTLLGPSEAWPDATHRECGRVAAGPLVSDELEGRPFHIEQG